MSLLAGAGCDMAEQLESGQVAICARCEQFSLDRQDLLEIDGPVICDLCGVAGAFYAGHLVREYKDKAMAKRWGADVIKHGFTAMPDLVLDVIAAHDKLDERHYLVLVILESFRRQGSGPVFPKIEQIHKRTPGWSRRKLERTLEQLRDAKLIEAKQRMRYGRLAENLYTRDGLDAKLQAAAERRASPPPEEAASSGSDAPSEDVAKRHEMPLPSATGDGAAPSQMAGLAPSQMADQEAEEREAEEVEADSSIEAARGAGEGASSSSLDPVGGSSVETSPLPDTPFDEHEVIEELVGFDPAIEGNDEASMHGAASVASTHGRSVGVIAVGNDAGSPSFGEHVADGNGEGGGRGERRAADLTDAEVLRALGDAESLDGEPESLAWDCWHPRRHAGREWRLPDSSRWQCGVCHPPVVPAVRRDAA